MSLCPSGAAEKVPGPEPLGQGHTWHGESTPLYLPMVDVCLCSSSPLKKLPDHADPLWALTSGCVITSRTAPQIASLPVVSENGLQEAPFARNCTQCWVSSADAVFAENTGLEFESRQYPCETAWCHDKLLNPALMGGGSPVGLREMWGLLAGEFSQIWAPGSRKDAI